MTPRLRYPDGRQFAFTIIDDTDDSTVENVAPLYQLLADLGFRTTKTVWPVACPEGSQHFHAGDTAATPAYRDFCLSLQRQGFELTWHGATMESSRRERTVEGLEQFRIMFGSFPAVHANHALNRENIYWGAKRYQSPARLVARLLRPGGGNGFEGEREGSPYFWGDLCKQHIRYVRNFAFRGLDTLEMDPDTPYALARTPWVRAWFSASDAPDVEAFCRLVTPEAVARLARQGGVCILATHLGKGFVRHGQVDKRVVGILQDLAARPGWFVPVSTVLDALASQGGGRTIDGTRLLKLEIRHLLDRVRSRLWR